MADALQPSNTDGLHHLVVELVLLRVPSLASLVRAAAVCKLWRRVIAHACSLRLHRSLHTPAVAGYFFNRLRFCPVRRIISTARPSFVPSQTPNDVDARRFFLPGFLDEDLEGLGQPRQPPPDEGRRHRPKWPTGFPDMLVVCDPLMEPHIFSAPGDTIKVFARLSGEWVLEEAVLQKATRGLPGYKPSFLKQPLMIWTCTPGLVTLVALARELWLFSVDLATMEVKKPATADMENIIMYQCELPWPPVLHACLS
ncbi:unnamed protein product [Urochloa decumbens]|uniref:F-box domain-containing protein n=1 Tax=Urochloa decumbens TaxID=240449 RepID=A0ABC9C145_9POAL